MTALIREIKAAAIDAPRLYFLPITATVRLLRRLARR
jgi:hypothetical protein